MPSKPIERLRLPWIDALTGSERPALWMLLVVDGALQQPVDARSEAEISTRERRKRESQAIASAYGAQLTAIHDDRVLALWHPADLQGPDAALPLIASQRLAQRSDDGETLHLALRSVEIDPFTPNSWVRRCLTQQAAAGTRRTAPILMDFGRHRLSVDRHDPLAPLLWPNLIAREPCREGSNATLRGDRHARRPDGEARTASGGDLKSALETRARAGAKPLLIIGPPSPERTQLIEDVDRRSVEAGWSVARCHLGLALDDRAERIQSALFLSRLSHALLTTIRDTRRVSLCPTGAATAISALAGAPVDVLDDGSIAFVLALLRLARAHERPLLVLIENIHRLPDQHLSLVDALCQRARRLDDVSILLTARSDEIVDDLAFPCDVLMVPTHEPGRHATPRERQAAAALDGLSNQAGLVRALSVFDGPFTANEAALLLSTTRQQCAALLRFLSRNGVLTRSTVPRHDSRPSYTFANEEERRTADRSLGDQARRKLNRLAADARMAESMSKPDRDTATTAAIVAHLMAAEDVQAAVRWQRQCADALHEAARFDDAAEAYDKVLALAASGDPSAHQSAHLEMVCRRAQCVAVASALGDVSVLDAAERGIENHSPAAFAGPSPLARTLRRVQWLRFLVFYEAGRLEACERVQRIIESSVGSEVVRGRARLADASVADANEHAMLSDATAAFIAWRHGRLSDFAASAHRAIATAGQIRRDDASADNRPTEFALQVASKLHGQLGLKCVLSLDDQAAHAQINRAMALADELGDEVLTTDLLTLAATFAIWSGTEWAATSYAVAATAIAQRLQLRGRHAQASLLGALARVGTAAADAPREIAAELSRAELRHALPARAFGHYQLAVAWLADGHPNRARKAISVARSLAREGALKIYTAEFDRLFIEIGAELSNGRIKRSQAEILRRAYTRSSDHGTLLFATRIEQTAGRLGVAIGS